MILEGGDKGDVLRSSATVGSTLYGNGGDDIFEGGSQGDTFDGGTGANTVSYEHSTASVSVDLTSEGFGGDALGDTYQNIQNIRGGPQGDILLGDTRNNLIEDEAGSDSIFGGGAGIDFAIYTHSSTGVAGDLTMSQQSTQSCDASGDFLLGIENLYGTTHDDTLTGDDNNIIIYGQGGADTISTMDGNDALAIRSTPTMLHGGTGKDKLTIQGNANVTLDDTNLAKFEAVAVGNGATVDLSGVTSFTGKISSASKAGGHVSITGTAGNDQISGNAGYDTFIESRAAFGRDRFTSVDLTQDTFGLSSTFAADNTAAHLHFVDYKGSTVIYCDTGRAGPTLTLIGVNLATAEAPGTRKATSSPARAPSSEAAARRARAIAAKHAGVVAFSRSGDPATGEFDDAAVIVSIGEVDLEALAA